MYYKCGHVWEVPCQFGVGVALVINRKYYRVVHLYQSLLELLGISFFAVDGYIKQDLLENFSTASKQLLLISMMLST